MYESYETNIRECEMFVTNILHSPISTSCDKGSLILVMGKCLWFSVKIKVGQSSLSSP